MYFVIAFFNTCKELYHCPDDFKYEKMITIICVIWPYVSYAIFVIINMW